MKLTSKQQILVIGAFFKKHIVKFGLVVIIGMLMFDLAFVGNLAYAAKWAGCGKRPAVLVSGTELFERYPVKAKIYAKPGLLAEKVSPFDSDQNGRHQLFCTVREAQSEALRLTDKTNITIEN